MRRLLFAGLVLAASAATGRAQAPVQPDQRGSEIYGRMCAICHGPAGEGYKADGAPTLGNPGFLGSVTDDFLRNAIANGRRGTTMSAWSVDSGGPLSPEAIDSLVAFLRTWETRPRPALDEHPAIGSPENGFRVFTARCAKCHGTRGTSGDYVGIGDSQWLQDAGNGFVREAIRKGRKKTPMLGFESSLSGAEIEDIMVLLRSWQSTTTAPSPLPPPRQAPIPLSRQPMNPNGKEPRGFNLYPLTTPADAIKAQVDRHAKMAILDARVPSDYMNEHIAGAASVPFYNPDPYFSDLPKDAWLVCYCSCPHAESGQLAQKLLNAGFTKVTVLDEGFNYWRSKHYETTKGRDP